MKNKFVSKDSWLVGCLAGAAFSFVMMLSITSGTFGSIGYFSQFANPSQMATGDDDTNIHEIGTMQHGEHGELFAMVPHAAATHVALGGDWFDAASWSPAEIPGDNALVLIPENISVTYGGQSEARIKWLRVDGELNFQESADSKLVVDTFIVDYDGTLEIGTENNPITGSVDIVIADNGDIDTTWDPLLQSRGVITHGKVRIHGEEKYVHGKVASDPMAGDTSITMQDDPAGWGVGDTIVIAGTRYGGYAWDNTIRKVRHYLPEDEVRVVTGVSGKTISFAEPLIHDHDSPRPDLKTSVANYSRNITFRSETGESAETRHRGHVMFMHNDDVDVRYAAFDHLGRTNKSVPSLEAVEFGSSITSGANVRGRYSVHVHRTGATDITVDPVIILGNSVFGSPGWGYVHHDSYAIFHNNASYDTFGAGYVAETGNEIGTWTNNIAIYAKGVSGGEPKLTVDLSTFDMANSGDGYYFQGRMVKSRNNVAASVNSGYAFFHRSYGCSDSRPTCALTLPPEVFDFPEAVYEGAEGGGTGDSRGIRAGKPPILHFTGNETFAASRGLHVTKSSPVQDHDVHTNIEDFTAWRVDDGAHLAYTGHYFLNNFDVVGDATDPYYGVSRVGILLSQNAVDMVVKNPKISMFQHGVQFGKGATFPVPNGKDYVLINPTLSAIGIANYLEFDPTKDILLDSDELQDDVFTVVLEPLFYESSRNGTHYRRVDIKGLKHDGVGTIEIPVNPDSNTAGTAEVVAILANEGYRTANGKEYIIIEEFFTDRATHEIHKFGLIAGFDGEGSNLLGNPYYWFSKAFDAGPIDFESLPPVAEGEREIARPDRLTTFDNLLSNDSDPDGDEIVLDGFSQPEHGIAYQTANDAITYRPDFDYLGEDKIKYWVSDNQGNFSPAYIAINVTAGNSRPAAITAPPGRLLIADNPATFVLPEYDGTPTPTPAPTTPESEFETESEPEPESAPQRTSGRVSASEPESATEETSQSQSESESTGSTTETEEESTSATTPDAITTSTNNNSSSGGSSSGGRSSSGGGSSSSDRDTDDSENTEVVSGGASANANNPTVSTSLPATDLFKANISYIQPQNNIPQDVRNLETFLNDFAGESLPVDGVYGAADNEAMKRFQRTYSREILDVWDLNEATGFVGITTRLKMNFLLKGQTAQCPVFTEYNGGVDGVYESDEVRRTKVILADLGMYNGPLDRLWTPQTNDALITFQETFREVMLDPWNITEGTGYKYKTTNKFLNYFVGCDTGAVELEGVGVYEGI